MNGPLNFLIARIILPLLDLLAEFKRMLACSCSRQIFAVARKLAFLSVLLEFCKSSHCWVKVNAIRYGA